MLALPLRGSTPELYHGKYVAGMFGSGEQGVWYDPSDYSTMFEDAAGTIPITSPLEKPVGLILDKSKGLVLGPELVTNGDFSNGTAGWTNNGSTISVVNGELEITSSGSAPSARQVLNTIAGKTYKFSYSLRRGTTPNSNLVRIGTTAGRTDIYSSGYSVSGAYVFYFTALSATTYIAIGYGETATGQTSYWDNISVRELPGNHAYQSTTTRRPTLSACVNLLTYTEQFDNAAWPKINITLTPNATTAPDGTLTADLFAATTNTNAYYYRGVSLANGTYTYSIYVKKFGVDGTFNFYLNDATNSQASVLLTFTGGVLRLSSVSTFNVFSAGSATATNIGNGWYRVAITATITNGTGPAVALAFGNTGRDGYSGIYIWGADLRVTNTGVNLPAYQRVNTATDYDTAGFPHYLKFDGIDDSLVTNRIDFTGTDKMMVCAGVRKLSDEAVGALVELSTVAGSQQNFSMNAPRNAGAGSYGITLRSTDDSNANVTQTGYSAPISNVLIGQFDYAAADNKAGLRVNGVRVGNDVITGTPTGNFGNHPLYIGRRGGMSLPFTGHLYGLIVRGAQTDDLHLTHAEKYLANKTGVTL